MPDQMQVSLRFLASLERLSSNKQPIVQHLRNAGLYGLALHVKHDIENIEHMLRGEADKGGPDAGRD